MAATRSATAIASHSVSLTATGWAPDRRRRITSESSRKRLQARSMASSSRSSTRRAVTRSGAEVVTTDAVVPMAGKSTRKVRTAYGAVPPEVDFTVVEVVVGTVVGGVGVGLGAGAGVVVGGGVPVFGGVVGEGATGAPAVVEPPAPGVVEPGLAPGVVVAEAGAPAAVPAGVPGAVVAGADDGAPELADAPPEPGAAPGVLDAPVVEVVPEAEAACACPGSAPATTPASQATAAVAPMVVTAVSRRRRP
jgi:hypothetical protein